MRRFLRSALFAGSVLAGLPAAQATERVALVIGNSAYKSQNVLANPVNDAADVSAMFRRLGFDVVEGLDLDGAGLKAKLKEFRDRLGEGSLAVFYYSGHGMQVDGRNYLVPTDAKIDKPEDVRLETVDLDLVLQLMRGDNRVSVVVLDACRDSPFARSLRRAAKGGATRAAESAYGGLAEVRSAIGSYVIYATDPGNVALDGDGRNSPFTEAFLKVAPQPGVAISTMTMRIRDAVVQATGARQLPWSVSTLVNDVYLAGGGPEGVQLAAYTPDRPGGETTTRATGPSAGASPKDGATKPAAPAQPPEPTAAELCDRLATDVQDPLRNRKVAPVRTVDVERAIPACEKAVAAAPKDLRLADQLGRAYAKAERWSDALRVFKEAAGRGSPYATNEVGFLYYRGFGGLPKDYAQARPWFEKAAQLGVADAMSSLAHIYAHGVGTTKNIEKAVAWLRRAEALGDGGAMVRLAWMNAEGEGIPKDEAKARELMQRAVDLEHPDAMAGMGLFAQRGIAGPQDFDAARKWFEKAAAYDSPDGMYNLGFFFLNGQGGAPRNYQIARDWFTRAAKLGSADALIGLGHMRLNGYGETADPQGARELLERAASHDHPHAMVYLAKGFRDGDFGTVDEAAAREWLKRAVALDHAEARERLEEMDRPETPGETCDRFAAMESDPLRPAGVKAIAQPGMIVHARAVPACEAAVKAELDTVRYLDQLAAAYVSADRWTDARATFAAAAAKKSAYAALWVGNIHARGHGTPKDLALAKKWYAEAAEGGSRDAMFNLALMYYEGTGVTRDYAAARRLFEQAAALGEVTAMRTVGEIWFYGRGVPEDNTRAREWFEKAAAGGDTRSKRRLGEIMMKGWGTKPDLPAARLWFQRAAAEGDTDAMRMLADLYLNGKGGDREPAKARGLLEQAADDGNARAMAELARMLLAGAVGEVDEAGARTWYEKAAAAGDETAVSWLAAHSPTAAPDMKKGEICDAAAGDEDDVLRSVDHPPVATVDPEVAIPACEAAHAAAPDELRWADQLARAYLFADRDLDALRIFREAAAAGSVYALVWMGNLHDRGRAGLAKNPEEAMVWWEKAAELGSRNAMINLGATLQERFDKSKDPADIRAAIEWLEKAAAFGEPIAMIRLAFIYKEGDGVPADPARYREWVTRAVEFGNTNAMRMLAVDAHDNNDDASARQLLQRAVDGGNIDALSELALFRMRGWGGPKDLEGAKGLLEKALSHQRTAGIRLLARAHEQGTFGKADKAEAKRLYRLAADLGDEKAAAALKGLE